jgi:outer membrane protein, heavy metal efflux system
VAFLREFGQRIRTTCRSSDAAGPDGARQAARNTEALLRRQALPQARAAMQSLLAGYSEGKGDLAAPIAAEHRAHDVELMLLKTELDQQVELAAIERLIGGAL